MRKGITIIILVNLIFIIAQLRYFSLAILYAQTHLFMEGFMEGFMEFWNQLPGSPKNDPLDLGASQIQRGRGDQQKFSLLQHFIANPKSTLPAPGRRNRTGGFFPQERLWPPEPQRISFPRSAPRLRRPFPPAFSRLPGRAF